MLTSIEYFEPKKTALNCQEQHPMPTMIHFTSLLVLALSLLSVSYSATFSVDVGKVDLNYTPDHVLGAEAGDTITFNFFQTMSRLHRAHLQTHARSSLEV